MKDYKYIRKHRRLLKMGRAFESRFGWLIAILQRIARILGWIGHKLRFLGGARVSQPTEIHQAVRLVHYQEVLRLLLLLDCTDHLPSPSCSTSMRTWRSSRSIMHQPKPSSSIIMPTSSLTSPTSSVRCSCLWRSFSSRRSWQATLKSSPFWHRCFLQATPSSLPHHLHHALSLELCTLCLRDSTRHGSTPEL